MDIEIFAFMSLVIVACSLQFDRSIKCSFHIIIIIIIITIIIIKLIIIIIIIIIINFVLRGWHITVKQLTNPWPSKFPIKLKFRNVDFCGGTKTGESGEKPSEQGREPI